MRHAILASIGLALQLLATPAWADRAHDLAAQAGNAQRRTCQNVTGLSTCHPQFTTGCSNSPNPQYDAYLNFLKNQTPAPTSSISRYIIRATIQSLDGNTPAGITSRNHAQHATPLADVGEGNIVAMIGYLYFVQNTGAESTNCGLHGPGETDYHVGIGFNRTIAQGLQDGHTPSDIEVKRLQQTSVVVEMTPHYRAQFKPKWTDTFLRRFIGCHRWHSCPSDHGIYVCGDLGHCSGCPDNQYCLAGQPQLAQSEPRSSKPESQPRPGVPPKDAWTCPESAPIKGNFTTYSGERCIYHPPGGQFYGKTKPERCYATQDEARADGCRGSKR